MTTDDPDTPTVDIAATGSGDFPLIQVNPQSTIFGLVPVDPVGGEIGTRDLVFQIRNTGDANLLLGSITSSNPEIQVVPVNPALPTVVSPDAEFTFTCAAIRRRRARARPTSRSSRTPASAATPRRCRRSRA